MTLIVLLLIAIIAGGLTLIARRILRDRADARALPPHWWDDFERGFRAYAAAQSTLPPRHPSRGADRPSA